MYKSRFLKEQRKGIPGKDRGRFDFFTDKELKKLDFYADEDDDINDMWYVFDDMKGFNWTNGVSSKEKAQKQAKELKSDLKDYLEDR